MTTTTLTPLAAATDAGAFGGKAAQLAAALGAGLPVPNGFALSAAAVRAVVDGDRRALTWLDALDDAGPWAVRSSAIGEDSAEASFAGTHLTLLGVVGLESLLRAINQVHDSAHDESAAVYRRQHGLDPTPRMAVVLQPMVASEVAGVLFTKNPVTGADERVIEASWGLGETVVSGLVSPDQYRLAPDDGRLLDRWAGEKDVALRLQLDGTVAETQVARASWSRHGASRRSSCGTSTSWRSAATWSSARRSTTSSSPSPTTGCTCSSADRSRMAEPAPAIATERVGRGLAGALMTASLMPLNSTMVAVAVPSIGRSVGHGPAAVTQALVATYLIAAIALQSPGGKLGDRLGHWRVLTLGQAAVGAGAILGFFAPNLATLAGARILMATGGALAVPATLALLRVSLPAERRGRAFGTFGAVMAMAAALGPIVGGVLVDAFGWEAVFVANVPVIAVAAILVASVERVQDARPTGRFDTLGSALLTAGLALLVLGAQQTGGASVPLVRRWCARAGRLRRARTPGRRPRGRVRPLRLGVVHRRHAADLPAEPGDVRVGVRDPAAARGALRPRRPADRPAADLADDRHGGHLARGRAAHRTVRSASPRGDRLARVPGRPRRHARGGAQLTRTGPAAAGAARHRPRPVRAGRPDRLALRGQLCAQRHGRRRQLDDALPRRSRRHRLPRPCPGPARQ